MVEISVKIKKKTAKEPVKLVINNDGSKPFMIHNNGDGEHAGMTTLNVKFMD